MHPLVSILIPAYNAASWIADTIKSALAQAGVRREIIVVDDGSTDDTLRIARQFASGQVLVLSQPNQGAAAARNHALSQSQGDYIQWLDADDILGPRKIEEQIAILDGTTTRRTLVSCAWGSFSYRLDKAVFRPDQLWNDLTPADWLINKFEHNLYMMNSCWLVSRELTEAAGPWDARLSLDDDGEYFSRVIHCADRIRFAENARCYYRKVGFNSLSQVDGSARKLKSLRTSLLNQVRYLHALENSPRTRDAAAKYLQRWLIYFHPEHPELVREIQASAATFGASLQAPRLRWKYAWLTPLVGMSRAKRVQEFLPELKHRLWRHADRALSKPSASAL